MFGWILVAVLWMMIWFLLGCIFTEWRIKNFPLIKVGCDEYGFPILRPEDIPPMPKCKPPADALRSLRLSLEDEALANRHFAVCFHNLLAQYGNDDDKKLFKDELGYGRDQMTVSEICNGALKILAETGNKNAQIGDAEFYPHPALESKA